MKIGDMIGFGLFLIVSGVCGFGAAVILENPDAPAATHVGYALAYSSLGWARLD